MDVNDYLFSLDRHEILQAVLDFLLRQPDETRISVMTITVGDDGAPQITATFC